MNQRTQMIIIERACKGIEGTINAGALSVIQARLKNKARTNGRISSNDVEAACAGITGGATICGLLRHEINTQTMAVS